ncbi:hypothetical protein [Bifidobacterium choloepi]|nr:hypothetical protein [Bifidobacterium choloepi]
MRRNERLETMLADAHARQRCAAPHDCNLQEASRRRVRNGELLSPMEGLFIDIPYWNGLDQPRQAWHLALGLQELRPGKYCFDGPTGAMLMGFEVPRVLHAGGLFVVGTRRDNRTVPMATSAPARGWKVPATLNKLYIPDDDPAEQWNVGGVVVTSPVRQLVVIAAMTDFPHALAVFDSAMKTIPAVNDDRLLEFASRSAGSLGVPVDKVRQLVDYANPLSDNGGESFARGVMIQQGFLLPDLQVQFPNPDNPDFPYRVDFCWRLPNGVVIVGELDGKDKYGDPVMTRGKSPAQIGHEESRRETWLVRHCGVTRVFRFTFADVLNTERFIALLLSAGIPRCNRGFMAPLNCSGGAYAAPDWCAMIQ